MEIDARSGFQGMFDAELVGFFIALGSGGADGRAFTGIEHAELDAGGVCVQAHDAAEGVDFPDHVSFCQSTDGGVAGHSADGIEVLGENCDATAEAGGGKGGFDPGVAGANDEDIVGFRVDEHWGREKRKDRRCKTYAMVAEILGTTNLTDLTNLCLGYGFIY